MKQEKSSGIELKTSASLQNQDIPKEVKSFLEKNEVSKSELLLKPGKSNRMKKVLTVFQEIFTLKILFVVAALFASFLLYFVTLKGCSTDAEMICVAEMVPLIPEYCFYMFIVAFVIDGVLFLTWKRVFPKLCAFLALFEIFLICLISNGHSFQSHGGYNRLIFLIALVLNLLTINCVGALWKIFQLNPKPFLFKMFIFIVVLYLLIFVFWFGRSCNHWDKGMKETKLEDVHCVLPLPKVCFYDLTSNWFDLSFWLNKNDCKKVINNIPLLNEEAEFVAYPKTQFFLRTEKNFEEYQKNILTQMKKVSEAEITEGKYEVVLDQRNNQKNILMNVFRNETFIARSQKILNDTESPKPKPLAKNILIVFIDSVSRQHFPRKLPKTYKWLENFFKNKDSPMETFQFFKYHTTAAHTTPNMMKIFYGTDYYLPNESNPLTKKFKKQGYITAKSNNFCGSTYFDISSNELQSLDMESFDHENTAMFCDPNYQKMDEDGSYGYMEGSFAMVRRCLYGKDTHTHVLDYGNKFWRTYHDMPKVLEVGFMDGHEPSSELLQYLDSPIHSFLTGLESENLLNDTAIVLFADHGHHVNIFYHLFQLRDLQFELKLPMIFMVLPRNIADSYGDHLRSYEQNLLGAYDIYNTFSFLGGDNNFHRDGVHLMNKTEKTRCYNDIDLSKDFCICKCEENEQEAFRRIIA